jgi:predicted enzyme related to lactoylglutathione lyase
MKLGKVGQLGIVVKDVKRATDFLYEQFGIGPFGIVPLDNVNAVYKGEEITYRIKAGICKHEDVMYEIIEVVEGECILTDPAYLPPSGQGLHHVGFFVADLDKAVEEWTAGGGKVLQRGSFLPGGGTCYLDTPAFCGMLVELIKMPEGQK